MVQIKLEFGDCLNHGLDPWIYCQAKSVWKKKLVIYFLYPFQGQAYANSCNKY